MFWGLFLGSVLPFLAGAYIQGRRGARALIMWLVQGFLFCTINSCQNHPSVEGAIAHVPPVSEAVLLLCQASCCRPVCLRFGNMSWVFHHCMLRLAVPLLRAITYLCMRTHACLHTFPWRNICLVLFAHSPTSLEDPGGGKCGILNYVVISEKIEC